VEGVVADVNPGNVLNFLGDADVVLDGTDNFTTRFLLNDACLSLGKPWIYTGVIASYGMTATLIPDGAVAHLPGRQATGCLRCFLPELPAPGTTPTCDTAGVIGPGVALLTAIAGAEAMKVLSGQGQLNPGIIHMDVWSHDYEKFALARNPECPVCGQAHEYEYLNAQLGTTSATLCGRNAVQVAVTNANGARLDLAAIAKQLAPVAKQISRNDYLLRAQVDGYEFTVFPDSRAIIKGTEDEELAKGLYARYLGG
jgi:adenylyltransferase/sulfurtransferase